MVKDLQHFEQLASEPHELGPVYVPEGDCLILYIDDRPSRAKRIDDLVTVYLANDNDDIVGCCVKEISRVLRQYGDFGVTLRGKEVYMGMLFTMVGVQPQTGEASRLFSNPLATTSVRLPEQVATG